MADEKASDERKEDMERIKDTNVEGIGSEEHRDLREEAAKKEKAWKGCGQIKGLEIWRIEKFKVKKWPKKRYGEFYSGDSYIILSTKEDDEGKKSYDVFFWLGAETTQDEAGTAAYKTVELDDLLGDEPVQYREVQGNESTQFINCFAQIKILQGGIESGFNKIKPEIYEPRLLHVSGYKKHVQVFQVKMDAVSLNNTDSFVLDAGLNLWQYNGNSASAWEKRKANAVLNEIKDNRHGKVKEVIHIDGLDDDQKQAEGFWTLLGGKPKEITDDEQKKQELPMRMLRLSNEKAGKDDGKVEVEVVCEGQLDKTKLDTDDVFIIDTGLSIYIWIGKGANKAEKRYAMIHATEYLQQEGRDSRSCPMCRIIEGKEPAHFTKILESKKENWDADMIGDEDGFVGRKSSVAVFRDLQE